MNYRLVLNILGKVMLLEAALMIPSLIVSIIYGDGDSLAFLITILIVSLLGIAVTFIKPPKTKMFARDGFMIVTLAWIILAVFGGLPFYISGAIPSFIDCIFETMSGFTTTGSSILADVEALPRGLLFWRSFTHWFGGMGVLVFFLTLIPSMGGRTQHLLRAESPGPSPGKLVPKIKETSMILYGIYFVLTVVCTICLLFAGMPLFDSVVHALGTAGTGGFSIKNSSISYYNSPLIDIIISVFMVIFGVNFTVYFYILKRNLMEVKKNSEVKLFLLVIGLSTLLITVNITRIYGSVWEAFYQAFFQVTSLISTTGYATADYNLWPSFSKMILIGLMFVGSCAGSTSGGLKQIRLFVMLKSVKRTIKKMVHPRSVIPIRADGKLIDEEQVSGIAIFCGAYFLIMIVATVLISLDNHDFETNFSAVLTAISNVGPGFGKVGPTGNFGFYSDFSKLILSLCMLVGRLEIFPVLMMFQLNAWKKA
ncbi:potassium transporter KefA [Anaerocolumna cellulosilytica]|uniref:Potassium transporter KefA n=1 Tax=Anaerocolumna cellulosilytica TaxID=433286 RepID=A0A6S6R8T6_9FIRM|nr:TrkH family potassium uptake protein [Anaerocolumna cellulosilytica]MBB5197158.1 trk system potassium uptake protein TrkH [Anaerocolumna cellulosilytica]BCJ95371.1 potassium transporter KefA [Anaerocolumna cellulosilytica]